MNRNDFISGKEGEKTPDPAIVTNQIWKAIEAKDFQDGRGKVDFSIIIRFFNPITNKWVCAFQGGGVVNSFNTFEMTKEDIFKGFQFEAMWQPNQMPPTYRLLGDPVPLMNDQTFFNNHMHTTGPMAVPQIAVSGVYVGTALPNDNRLVQDLRSVFGFPDTSTTAGEQPTAIAETSRELGSFAIS